MGVSPPLIYTTVLGDVLKLKVERVYSWGAGVPDGFPSGYTYGSYVVFQVNNTGRYLGISACAYHHYAIGFGENPDNMNWDAITITT